MMTTAQSAQVLSPPVRAAVTASVTLNPGLQVADPGCAYWLAQVMLRLRREIAWCRYQRGEGVPTAAGRLPPITDPAQDSLDLSRWRHEQRAFFAADVTARYLSESIAALGQSQAASRHRGDWAWIAAQSRLTPAAQFVLACALCARIDASIGPVCAAAQNDLSRPWPTLALAQRLWGDPLAITACADERHTLFRHGLLTLPTQGETLDWQQPLEMPALLAQALSTVSVPIPDVVPSGSSRPRDWPQAMRPLLARLHSAPPTAMQVLPLQAARGTDFTAWARALAQAEGRGLMVLGDDARTSGGLSALATLCWLRGMDLLLPEQWLSCSPSMAEHWFASVAALPLRWYLPITDGESLAHGVPASLLLPTCTLPVLNVEQRRSQLASALQGCAPGLRAAVPEAAHRFRLGERPLARVAAAAMALDREAGAGELFALCRAEAGLELDGLVNPVTPRFALDELVLPPAPLQQLREIVAAMGVLGRVHHEWGTALAWNESGLSVLFCGPPGTGKTMAAEALASELQLPMYRIDLSQVVNKYIGETEKNLRRIFDAAETSDCLLFFDEADALFGKRTEVRDAHDRFANIEISYLLERMERFKGLAVLASNRRKDLDEAFTRRLRHIVEFPVPGTSERERLWRQVFPERVDVSGLDCRWLAQQFELAGGHIRSAAFNACLLAASAQTPKQSPRVEMAHVLIAIKRELEKMNRVADREQFGRYAALMEDVA